MRGKDVCKQATSIVASIIAMPLLFLCRQNSKIYQNLEQKNLEKPDFVKCCLAVNLFLYMQGDFCEILASFDLLEIPIEHRLLSVQN